MMVISGNQILQLFDEDTMSLSFVLAPIFTNFSLDLVKVN